MDAYQLPWDKYSGYAFPLIGRCLWKVREERAPLVLIDPVWKSHPQYPSCLAGTASGLSLVITKQSNAVDRPIRPPSLTDDSRPVASSSLEVIRQRQQSAGISGEASQLLATGWSKGTNTTYQSAWKQWDGWCSKQQVDPISSLKFLTSLFKEGM